MKWIGISGSREALPGTKAEEDVRREVRDIITRGDGIVSGGALGIDYFATDEALKLNPSAEQIKIFLPTTLEIYAKHYRSRAEEGVITKEAAEVLIQQLETLQKSNSESLIENKGNAVVDKQTYYERNTDVMDASDEILAFRVTNSGGTQDTIDKAREKGTPVKEFNYKGL
ncbi:MAG: DNA-protecting protein DprA [Candidatus Colwellbacteria bacterium]|nr:DNA-protecting protein DprA [Candidatus Colwellbacteria bacterium]